jgi:hypothetical protein
MQRRKNRMNITTETLLFNFFHRILMTEANVSVEKLVAYYGNTSHPIAHFPFNNALISASQKNITAQSIYSAIKTWMDNLPKGAWPNWVVSWTLLH